MAFIKRDDPLNMVYMWCYIWFIYGFIYIYITDIISQLYSFIWEIHISKWDDMGNPFTYPVSWDDMGRVLYEFGGKWLYFKNHFQNPWETK